MLDEFCHQGVNFIILRPELRSRSSTGINRWPRHQNPLSRAITFWLNSAAISFPCEFLAFAYSNQGQALLEGFDFFKVRNAAAMPDKAPPSTARFAPVMYDASRPATNATNAATSSTCL